MIDISRKNKMLTLLDKDYSLGSGSFESAQSYNNRRKTDKRYVRKKNESGENTKDISNQFTELDDQLFYSPRVKEKSLGLQISSSEVDIKSSSLNDMTSKNSRTSGYRFDEDKIDDLSLKS